MSQRFWFRTAPADLSRLSFIAGGDSRNNRDVRRNANLLVAKLKPHAVLFSGDMINSDVDLEWQDWMDVWTPATGSVVTILPAVECTEEGNPCDDGDPNTIDDTINSSCDCVGTPTSGTVAIPVSNGNDDVEQSESTGAIYVNSTDLELVYDTYNNQFNQTVGMRFTNVGIPQGATIARLTCSSAATR